MRTLALVALLMLTPFFRAEEPAEVKLSAEEKKLLDLTNAERTKNKLPPFRPNAQLAAAARLHTTNMAKAGKLDHDLDGSTLTDRLKMAGYAFRKAAENIAFGPDVSPEVLFKGWMESPLHKANLLNGDYTEIGIGWSRTPKGVCYATQVFGTPRPK